MATPAWFDAWLASLGTPPTEDVIPVLMANGAGKWARIIATGTIPTTVVSVPGSFVMTYGEAPTASVLVSGQALISDANVTISGTDPTLALSVVTGIADSYVSVYGENPTAAVDTSISIAVSDALVGVAGDNPTVSVGGSIAGFADTFTGINGDPWNTTHWYANTANTILNSQGQSGLSGTFTKGRGKEDITLTTSLRLKADLSAGVYGYNLDWEGQEIYFQAPADTDADTQNNCVGVELLFTCDNWDGDINQCFGTNVPYARLFSRNSSGTRTIHFTSGGLTPVSGMVVGLEVRFVGSNLVELWINGSKAAGSSSYTTTATLGSTVRAVIQNRPDVYNNNYVDNVDVSSL